MSVRHFTSWGILPTGMWQQLGKFPVRLNKNIQTNYFRTKNGDKTLKYNIKSEQSLCVGKYSMSSTAYLSRHTTFNKEAQYDCSIVLYPNYVKGIVCHTPNRYHIRSTVYSCTKGTCTFVCVSVCLCVLSSHLFSTPVFTFRYQLGAPAGVTHFFLFFFRWWDKTMY